VQPSIGLVIAVVLIVTLPAIPQEAAAADANANVVAPPPSSALNQRVAAAVRGAIEQFPQEKVKDDEVAVTLLELSDPVHIASGSYRGDAPIFPASVVKLFYLAATHRWLQDGKLQDSAELKRTMHDMIIDSSNDATASILESLTEAPGGAPLVDEQMKAWEHQRNAVNRYYAGLGFTGINVCQKTYCEGPYGRERIFLGEHYENRNKLTTDATARLLAEIALRRAVSADRSREMMTLLARDWTSKAGSDDADDQAHGFTALAGLPAGTKLWSKAGWTSTARHDAAYLELPDGRKLVLVIFTSNHAKNRQLLPAIARRLIQP
jgi:hypothetical protein